MGLGEAPSMTGAAERVDLDALFAEPSAGEVATVWDSFPTDVRAEGFRLLGEPLEREGVIGQFLEYRSEGLRIYGQLYRPVDVRRGPFPLIMANHGGVRGIGPLDPVPGPGAGPSAAGGDLPERSRPLAQWCWDLAKAGYVSLVSGYRGEDTPLGRSEGEIELARGEVWDVLTLLACGTALPYVDAIRVGMWGFSHGAWITALAAQRSPDLRAGVCLAAPGDVCWTGRGDRSTRAMVASLLAGTAVEALGESLAMTATLRAVFRPLIEGRASVAQTRREMIARGPRFFAGRTRCPLLLACGDRDDIYQHTVALDVALGREGKEHEFAVFAGLGHAVGGRNLAAGARTPWEVTKEFLDRRLRPPAP